ncbi:STAS domain-containing protein [Streptomyces sp. NPDC006314]|uniref:STAS domain-containing protein n=1 Tax=Streptomyces sp. NPDC006314 TaxID=3154475 RepID=UPI0033BF518E
MSADLRLTVREAGDRLAVLTLTGALDFRTADGFHEQATAVLTTRRHVVLDMSQVTFCDSSGLSTLLRLLRHAQTNDATLALAAVPAQTQRLLAITGAHTVFSIHASLMEALAAQQETAPYRRPSSAARAEGAAT